MGLLHISMSLLLAATSASADEERRESICFLEWDRPVGTIGDLAALDSSPLSAATELDGGDRRLAPESSLEEPSWPFTLAGCPEVEIFRSERGGFRYGVSLLGRVSFFEGDTQFNKDHLGYSDVFRAGLGVSGEFELISKIGPEWWWGGYISLGEDTFGGGATNTDSLGVTVKPDDLTILSVLVGLKTGFVHDTLFGEAHLGLGLAHYLANKATIDSGSGPQGNQEFLRTTDRLAAELGGRFGWGTPSLFVDLGLGFRVQGGPERGSKADVLVNPEAMVTLYLEFGLTLRF